MPTNIPIGTVVSQGNSLSPEITKEVSKFMESKDSGYFAITTQGLYGIEEGVLIIDSGQVAGAHYDYMAFNKEYFAGEAVKRVLNSFLASKGVYDLYKLTTQQLELLKIFNEQVLLLEKLSDRSLEGMFPINFSHDFEKQEATPGELDRTGVLKKRGLEEIKVDSYQTITNQMSRQLTTPKLSEKVEKELEAYLSAKPLLAAKPKQLPKVEEVAPETKPVPRENYLKDLDEQAERLKKLLDKK